MDAINRAANARIRRDSAHRRPATLSASRGTSVVQRHARAHRFGPLPTKGPCLEKLFSPWARPCYRMGFNCASARPFPNPLFLVRNISRFPAWPAEVEIQRRFRFPRGRKLRHKNIRECPAWIPDESHKAPHPRFQSSVRLALVSHSHPAPPAYRWLCPRAENCFFDGWIFNL